MILVSGFNVYPNEIEGVVATCPGVLECASVGVPDEKSGEAVKIVVVKKDPNLTKEQSSSTARRTSPATRCRAWSSSAPSCPRPRSARFCGASCATPRNRRRLLKEKAPRCGAFSFSYGFGPRVIWPLSFWRLSSRTWQPLAIRRPCPISPSIRW